MKYFFSLLVLMSCGASSNQDSENVSTSNEVSSSTSCLAEMTDPATWLTLSTAASIANIPETEIEEKAYKNIECQYNWKSGRKFTMKIGNSEIEADASDKIAVAIKNLDTEIEKWLSKSYVKKTEMSYVEYFDQFHGSPMTKEDKQEINKQLDKKAEKDENFDEKSAATAKGMLAMSNTEDYTDLNDLGDKANYYVQVGPNLRELRLAVLSGNVVVSIFVDVSDDDADDLATAKAVAEAVMAKCD